MNFLSLFIVALMPVVKTLLITGLGLYLALESVNMLGSVSRPHLNNLVFYVFTPALVATNLATTITAGNIASLWFMPVNIILIFIIGSGLGWILAKISRTPKHLHGLVIGCCSAGNMGNMLLIIIPAVCNESKSPFGDKAICTTNGNAYASLSMAIGAVYIWTYTYNVMMVYGSKKNEGVNATLADTPESSTEQLLLSKEYQSSEDYEARAVMPPIGSEEKVSVFKKMKENVKGFSEKINLKMVLAPSTIATILGLFIGVITPLRSSLVGADAPLRVVESSAALVGQAAIPGMTLIVGANLLRGLRRSAINIWVIIGVNVVRNIALPLLGILIVKGANRFGWVGTDPLYQFILLLQYAVPCAMALGTITQLFEVGESECSVIMLWNYVVSAISLTLWSAYYMWIV